MSERYRQCAKCGLKAGDENIHISLHRFPPLGKKNIERIRAWATFCYPNEDWTTTESLDKLYKQHKLVCSKHFSDIYYKTCSTKKRLCKYAIPTETQDLLGPGPSTREDILIDVHNTQIPSKSKGILKSMDVRKVVELSPRKKKLYKTCRRNLSEIARLRHKFKNTKNKYKRSAILQDLASNANVNRMLEKKITGPFALLLQSQFINTPRKLNGHRWRTDDKILALGIYKKSTACYRLLRRLFCLPSPNTLKGLLNKVPLKCGINPKIFDTIKGVAEKRGTDENLCIMTFDEISIRKNLTYNSKMDQIEGYQDHVISQGRSKEVATHALLFMAIGLRKKWKQPLAFYFSGDSVTADRLKVLIKEDEMYQYNNYVVTVCDLDGGNIKALKLLGSSTDRPYFEFDGHEIVTILDPPHLLKCFRNMFLKYNIECKEAIQVNERSVKGVAKWSHIKDFFEKDNSNPNFVFAPALTKQHLDPNGKQKMKVRLAAQILSHSVASGLYAKISANELPREETATAMVVNKMDQIFDILNGETPDLKKGKSS